MESDLQKKKELLKESEGSEVLKGDEVSDKTGEFYGKRKWEGDWR